MQKTESQKKVICVVAYDPIKIYISWTLQNERQNLRFVKAICSMYLLREQQLAKKWPVMVLKWPTHSLVIFISYQSLYQASFTSLKSQIPK